LGRTEEEKQFDKLRQSSLGVVSHIDLLRLIAAHKLNASFHTTALVSPCLFPALRESSFCVVVLILSCSQISEFATLEEKVRYNEGLEFCKVNNLAISSDSLATADLSSKLSIGSHAALIRVDGRVGFKANGGIFGFVLGSFSKFFGANS